jgi:hypothetical protein
MVVVVKVVIVRTAVEKWVIEVCWRELAARHQQTGKPSNLVSRYSPLLLALKLSLRQARGCLDMPVTCALGVSNRLSTIDCPSRVQWAVAAGDGDADNVDCCTGLAYTRGCLAGRLAGGHGGIILALAVRGIRPSGEAGGFNKNPDLDFA